MHFRAEHYLDTARERVFSAVRLYEISRYSVAIYLSGVAVECLLRAYILRETKEFESRHDLTDLMRKSSIADFIPPQQTREFGVYLTTVWRRWKNNYRYASISRLSSEFRDIGLFSGIKGDPLKENARVTILATEKIISAGVLAWNSKQE